MMNIMLNFKQGKRTKTPVDNLVNNPVGGKMSVFKTR